MYKEVNCDSFLNPNDVKPRLEELSLFRPRKARNDDDDEDDDDDHVLKSSLLKELEDQMAGLEEDQEAIVPFVPGDLVQITSGELRNLIAKITKIDAASKSAQIQPYSNSLLTETLSIEMNLLVKYVAPGFHVKVGIFIIYSSTSIILCPSPHT